ncbi:MAG TPA: 2-oxoglutarate dehydrogenase complex dihydrolipoyllysine-residue succinyltransferase [Acidiferrobacteraceae bacterium]|mgnify:CR=1 FL=1|nr:2-oxoglutarate dehydrogenase complex dihydrolipoyllysine-residue succinyltransferase [Acidiferrobacteraceae bacterium]
MTIEVKVPSFPESVSDGEVIKWHKHVGDAVKEDEVIVDIETDKVVFEVPAPQQGVVQEILEQEGATVVSGQVLARLDKQPVENLEPSSVKADDNNKVIAHVDEEKAGPHKDALNAPAAEKLIREHNLDTQQIVASGKDGRILKEDVLRFLQQQSPAPDSELSAPVTAKAVEPDVVEHDQAQQRTQKRVPMTRLRSRIAERLLEAQHNAAILTTFNEVNMQPVMDLRARYREQFEKEHGVRLGFMSFFVKASVEALKQFPDVNASIDGDDIVYHGFIDIGIAVASPRGLVVPILRSCEKLNMAEIESQVAQYAEQARDGKLAIEDITGGTFTITNGGVFGSLLSTPILNPPQSAILGMHKAQPRPVVEEGEITVRPMMYLALSYDHRIIDGQAAVRFLVKIKDCLEDPARMLLGV